MLKGPAAAIAAAANAEGGNRAEGAEAQRRRPGEESGSGRGRSVSDRSELLPSGSWHSVVTGGGIGCGFSIYRVSWCLTAVSIRVKQDQGRSTPLLKGLEMESVVSLSLLQSMMIKRDC